MERFEALATEIWKDRKGDLSKWRPLVENFQILAADSEDLKVIGFLKFVKGLLCQAEGQYDEAKKYVEEAHYFFKESNTTLWLARAKSITGFLLANQAQFIKAIDYWHHAYNLGKEMNDREIIITNLFNIGIANRAHLQRDEDALEYFYRVLDLCLETDPPYPITGNVYSGISKCYLALGKNDLALENALSALSFSERFGDKRTLGWALELCVTTYIKLSDLDKALFYAKKNLKLWVELGDAYGLSIAYLDYSKVLRLLNRLSEAYTLAIKALPYAEKMNSQLILEQNYTELAALAEEMGDYKKSLEMYKAYMAVRENLLKESFNQEITKISADLKLENYRLKHIELSDKIKALKEAQDALVRSEKMNALLGLVGGVAHEINTPLGNSMMLNSFLVDKCEELLKSTEANFKNYQAYRNYIEMSLDAQKSIDKNLNTVAKIVESFKRIAVTTNPVRYQVTKIFSFLTDWVNGLKVIYPMYTHNIRIIGSETVEFPIDVTEMLTIFNELFLNVMRHAYPLETDVEKKILEIEYKLDENLDFIIRDFGAGMDETLLNKAFEPFTRKVKHHEGLGIGLHVAYNIVVYRLLGSIEIHSKESLGTEVSVKLFPPNMY